MVCEDASTTIVTTGVGVVAANATGSAVSFASGIDVVDGVAGKFIKTIKAIFILFYSFAVSKQKKRNGDVYAIILWFLAQCRKLRVQTIANTPPERICGFLLMRHMNSIRLIFDDNVCEGRREGVSNVTAATRHLGKSL